MAGDPPKVTGKAVQTKGAGGPKTLDEIERIRLRSQAVQWKCQGRTYRWIADRQGISVSNAYERVQQGFKDLHPIEEANSYRARQLAEWESMRKILWDKMLDPEVKTTDMLAAMDRLLRLQNQEANLLGLQMPLQVEHKHSGSVTVELDEDIAALVADIEARAAEARSKIIDTTSTEKAS
jgi:hypothetical protein